MNGSWIVFGCRPNLSMGSRAHLSQGHGRRDFVRRTHPSSYDYTTFFFSNFPNDYGEMDMLKIFQKWARVKEVFISCRLNKWDKRFGFVRFFEVRNAGNMERELDQIYVGNRKLYVNIPKYRRHLVEPNRVERKEDRIVNKVRTLDYGKNKVEEAEVNVLKKGKEVWVEKKGNKTYVDVVKSHARGE